MAEQRVFAVDTHIMNMLLKTMEAFGVKPSEVNSFIEYQGDRLEGVGAIQLNLVATSAGILPENDVNVKDWLNHLENSFGAGDMLGDRYGLDENYRSDGDNAVATFDNVEELCAALEQAVEQMPKRWTGRG